MLRQSLVLAVLLLSSLLLGAVIATEAHAQSVRVDGVVPGYEAGTVFVQARGFASVERAWRVAPGEAVHLEIVLSLAPLSERITVTAARIETRRRLISRSGPLAARVGGARGSLPTCFRLTATSSFPHRCGAGWIHPRGPNREP